MNIEMGGLVLLALGVDLLVRCDFLTAKRIPYNHAIWHLFVLAWLRLPFLRYLSVCDSGLASQYFNDFYFNLVLVDVAQPLAW